MKKKTTKKQDSAINMVSPSYPGESLMEMLRRESGKYFVKEELYSMISTLHSIPIKKAVLARKITSLIKNQNEPSVAHVQLNNYFESCRGLHMYDALTLTCFDVTKKIVEKLIIPNMPVNAKSFEGIKRYAAAYNSTEAVKAAVRVLTIIKL